MKLLVCFLASIQCAVTANRIDQICDVNGRRVYLEPGRKGNLMSRNANKERVNENFFKYQMCTLEIVTCPSCIIDVNFGFLDISTNCGLNTSTNFCACGYILFYEMAYEEKSSKQFCGHFIEDESSTLSYKTKTKTLVIKYVRGADSTISFNLHYSSERNRQLILTDADEVTQNFTKVISTPYFPSKYPNDLSLEYVINCNSSVKCKILLIFTDYQLSSSSTIEFYDWNGARIYTRTNDFRPPLIISTGPILLVRFYGNGRTSIGFRAEYSYLLDNHIYSPPIIDCGGHADNLGGTITMMNMVKIRNTEYRCYWIIRPPKNYYNWKTDIYLKVAAFSGLEGSELTIRRGITSCGEILDKLKPGNQNYSVDIGNSHIVPIKQGFYMSFSGVFTPTSKLVVVYSAFSYKDCFVGSNFMCENKRCISILLLCDGFDHCGDNSDEPERCMQDAKYFHKSLIPNFYFPRSHYYDLKTTIAILFICGLGIIGLIFGAILLLYRINTQGHTRRRFEDHMQTINAILEEGRYHGEEVEIISDDPPNYEAPPPYDEIASLNAPPKKIRRRSANRKDEQFSSATVAVPPGTITDDVRESNQAQEMQDVTVQITASTSTQRKIGSPPPAYSEGQQFEMTIDNARTSVIENEIRERGQLALTKWLNDEDIRASCTKKLLLKQTRSVMFIKRRSTWPQLITSLSESNLTADKNNITKGNNWAFRRSLSS